MRTVTASSDVERVLAAVGALGIAPVSAIAERARLSPDRVVSLLLGDEGRFCREEGVDVRKLLGNWAPLGRVDLWSLRPSEAA